MATLAEEVLSETRSRPAAERLELLVRDHPGALPQVCGLMMRRRFEYTALSFTAVGDGHATISLVLPPGQRRDQIERQLSKLYDVLGLRWGEIAEQARTG